MVAWGEGGASSREVGGVLAAVAVRPLKEFGAEVLMKAIVETVLPDDEDTHAAELR